MSIQGGINNALTTVGALTALGGPTKVQLRRSLKNNYNELSGEMNSNMAERGATAKRLNAGDSYDQQKLADSIQVLDKNIIGMAEQQANIAYRLQSLGDKKIAKLYASQMEAAGKLLDVQLPSIKQAKDKQAADKQAADKKAELDAIGKKIMEVK